MKKFKVVASGNTYPHLDLLKQHSFRWDPENKVWHHIVSEEVKGWIEHWAKNGDFPGVKFKFEEVKE